MNRWYKAAALIVIFELTPEEKLVQYNMDEALSSLAEVMKRGDKVTSYPELHNLATAIARKWNASLNPQIMLACLSTFGREEVFFQEDIRLARTFMKKLRKGEGNVKGSLDPRWAAGYLKLCAQFKWDENMKQSIISLFPSSAGDNVRALHAQMLYAFAEASKGFFISGCDDDAYCVLFSYRRRK